MNPPYTDQYSIGVDRELAANLGMSVTYVHKRSKDQIGWRDVGGVYGTQTVTAPNGQPVTVYPLLNSASARRFLRTNGEGFFSRYNGIMFAVSRRLANRWTANVNYTYSAADEPCADVERHLNDRKGSERSRQSGGPGHDRSAAHLQHQRIVRDSKDRGAGVGEPRAHVGASRTARSSRSGCRRGSGTSTSRRREPITERANSGCTCGFNKILFRRGPHRIEVGAEIRNAPAGNEHRQSHHVGVFQPELRQGRPVGDAAPVDVPVRAYW